MIEPNNKIAVFQEKKIRRTWHDDQWYFSIVDVIEVLTGSPRARKYWNALKTKLISEGYSELSQNVGQLKMQSADGKNYKTDASILRGYLELSCQFLHQRQSHSNYGWRKWVRI